MVKTDQEIIVSIIERLKKSDKVSFRDNNLLETFIIEKGLISLYTRLPEEKILPKLIQTDYSYFKQRLINYLLNNSIPFIQGPEDFLDIFKDKNTYHDYIKVYSLQRKIDNLDIIASDTTYSDEERVKAFENMYELYSQERDILERHKE